VSLASPGLISLAYGSHGQFTCEVDPAQTIASLTAPRPSSHFEQELQTALTRPLDFPPLGQAVVSTDLVAIALDRDTPESATILAAIWEILEQQGVEPGNVSVIQVPSPGSEGRPTLDPRENLPEAVREDMQWTIHDPADKEHLSYLASTDKGDRVYLTRELVEADFVMAAGRIAFDSVMGHIGTNSVYYPSLSSADAIAGASGQGHSELGPTDVRPLRQVVDDVAWLLGSMFSVQVIPSAAGGAARILAGASDSVFQLGKHYLAEEWMIELDERAEMVVAAVDVDAGGHGWDQVARALEAARNLVARDGKIVILSELAEELGPGIELIARSDSPVDAIRPLRELLPPDLVPATQLANAVDWADVYLLSRLDSETVDNLFMIPLDGESEVERLLDEGGTCVFLESAQHTCGRIRSK
jgi:nickel-dependent lactate racemase